METEVEGKEKEARFLFLPNVLYFSVCVYEIKIWDKVKCFGQHVNVSVKVLFLPFRDVIVQQSCDQQIAITVPNGQRPCTCTEGEDLLGVSSFFFQSSDNHWCEITVKGNLSNTAEVYILIPGAKMLAAVPPVSQWANNRIIE